MNEAQSNIVFASPLEAQRRMMALAQENGRLRDALVRIQDLTQHNMGMSAQDETCVWREATEALKEVQTDEKSATQNTRQRD